MNEAVARMISEYACHRLDDYVRALREILQKVALLGLWRSKFFERGAFYGGTALRVLYGLDRFSEGLDFSLLEPMPDFDFSRYSEALQMELKSFGFEVTVDQKAKLASGAIQSVFIKTDTLKQLLVIKTGDRIIRELSRVQALKIKVEVDTDPPPGFKTEARHLLRPVPFSVRSCTLPDLFAGKMHAALCRRWKGRAKGRDWYDFTWFGSNHPKLRLSHLEKRMVQSGDWEAGEALTPERFHARLTEAIDTIDLEKARKEVESFVQEPDALQAWSKDYFKEVSSRIELV